MKNIVIVILFICGFRTSAHSQLGKPNILIIYVDDLGYGITGCYGAKNVKTPNIDKMAKSGLLFTDGHCTAATCTPSRFSLLTGSYAFRNEAAILPGDAPYSSPPVWLHCLACYNSWLYHSSIKWHLGLGNTVLIGINQLNPDPPR